MPSWSFAVCDRFGTPLGELIDASSRTVRIPLNGLVTGSFVLQTNNAMANQVRKCDQVLIKAYRDDVLKGIGPVAPTYNKVVNESTKTIATNWSGGAWRLSRRLIESSKSRTGVTYGTALAPVERGSIVQTFLNELNGVNDTGIRVGSIIPAGTTYVGPWQYKNALQGVNDLSATLDGFDYRFDPMEPTVDSLGLAIGTFNSAPAIGGYKPEAVFEYGDGRMNVASFTEVGDVTGIMNRGYILPSGFPDNTTQDVLSYVDVNAIANSGQAYEDVVTSDLVSDDLRSKLIYEHVLVRRTAKMVITFQPTVDRATGVMPEYGVDYSEGDIVPFRAVENNVETVNGLFRVYAVEFMIDDQGNETPTPVLLSQ